MKKTSVFVLVLLVASSVALIAPAANAESIPSWASTTSYPINMAASDGNGVTMRNCAVFSGYVYCVGGYNGAFLNKVYSATYSGGTIGAWNAQGNFPHSQGANCFIDSSATIYCIAQNILDYATVSAGTVSGWTAGTAPTNVYSVTCDYVQATRYVYCFMGSGAAWDFYAAHMGTGDLSWSTSAIPAGMQADCNGYANDLTTVTDLSGTVWEAAGCNQGAGYYEWTATVAGTTIGTWGASTIPLDTAAGQSCVNVQTTAYIYCIGGVSGGAKVNYVQYGKIGPGGSLAWTAATLYPINVIQASCFSDSMSETIACVGGDNAGGYQSVAYGSSPLIGQFTCSITNLDASNYVLPSGKVYDFRCTVQSNAISGANEQIADVRIQFNDSVTTATAEYLNSSASNTFGFILDAGSSIVSLSPSGTVTNSYNAGVRTMVVNFELTFSQSAADSANRGIYLFACQTSCLTNVRGYEYLGNLFNILNKGGAISVLSAGACSIPAGADTFQTECHYGSNAHNWIAENATYYNLQNYQSQFSINLTNQSDGATIPSFWEPYFSGAGSTRTTNKGDWTLSMGLYDYDNTTWVKGINFKLLMLNGRVGSSNLWTEFDILWYNGHTQIANNTFYAFVPATGNGNPSNVGIWVNLWYSQNNASTVQGGEVAAYYTGMHAQNYLIWSSWSPFLANSTQSQTFVPLLNHSSVVMSSQQAQFTKVFQNMTRPGAPNQNAHQPNFQIETQSYAEQEFGVASSGMSGITTPTFSVAIVPTITSSSVFSPIINAIKSIASFFSKALLTLGTYVWNGLGTQFPWFTNTVGGFANLMVNLVNFLGTLIADFITILKFLYADLGLVAVPFQIIGNGYGYISSILGTAFKGVNASAAIEVAVIFFFVSWFFSTLESKNPAEGMMKMASTAWHVADAILMWTWYVAKLLIDTIEGLIP